MAREWHEGRNQGENQPWRGKGERQRSYGSPEDEFDYDRRREFRGDDRHRNPITGTHQSDWDDDFGYERQGGDYRGGGGYAPRGGMERGYPREAGSREFGPSYGGRDDQYRGARGEGYGSDYERGRGGGTLYGSAGDYGGRAGSRSSGYGSRSAGADYLGRGYEGSDERNYGEGAFRGRRDYSGRGSEYGGRGRHGEDRSFWDRASDEISSWFGDDEAEQRRRADMHRGRGPKGYKRSDERITEDINDRLSDDPYIDASEIEVSVSGGEATLTGTVDSRSAKRRAEDIAESVSGVNHCQNNLRIRQAARGSSDQSQYQGGPGAGVGLGASTSGLSGAGGVVGGTGTTGTGTTTGSAASTGSSGSGAGTGNQDRQRH